MSVTLFLMSGDTLRFDTFLKAVAKLQGIGDVIWDEDQDRMVEVTTWTKDAIEWSDR